MAMTISFKKFLCIPLLLLPCSLLFACAKEPQSGKLARVDWDGKAGSVCHLTFTPIAGGAEFTLRTFPMACEPNVAVIGQSYRFRYDVVRSFAAGCMGDVNCKDFQDIKMLVEITPQ
jgi:hypothetical protein